MEPLIVSLFIFSLIIVFVWVFVFTQSIEWLNVNLNRLAKKKRILWIMRILCWSYYLVYLSVAIPVMNFFMFFFVPKFESISRYDDNAHALICYGHFVLPAAWTGYTMMLLFVGATIITRIVSVFYGLIIALFKDVKIDLKNLKK